MPEIKTFSGGDDQLPEERVFSLDVFRGLVLLLLLLAAANGSWARHLAEANPDSWWAQFTWLQFSHVSWRGCSLFDLVQPAFLFIVGVALPFSFLKRARVGERYGDLLVHALKRSTIFLFLGVFLVSMNQSSTNWSFVNCLTQIGLGYFLLFIMWRKWWRVQMITGVSVLVLYWLLFVLWAPPGENFDWSIAGDGWTEQLTGFAAHWNKNANPAHAFDVWLLNGFSRPDGEPFTANPGGYQTLNFIPAFVTMLIGLMIGEYIQDENKGWAIPKVLVFIGFAGILLGLILDWTGVCPMVKRIWTPSFVLYSAGWCSAILGLLYLTVELNYGVARLFKPISILGLNSLVIYLICQLVAPWLNGRLQVHLGENYAGFFGEALRPLMENLFVLVLVWLFAWWLYRRRIFVRV